MMDKYEEAFESRLLTLLLSVIKRHCIFNGQSMALHLLRVVNPSPEASHLCGNFFVLHSINIIQGE